MPGPELVVDNSARDERLIRKAIRRLTQSNPNHTYDDVQDEFERLKKEENEIEQS